MGNYIKQLKASKNFRLEKHPTDITSEMTADFAKEELKSIRKKLAKLQDVLYANNKYSVLICLQGMDTAGKDSLIRELFKDFNVRGVEVNSFKTPSSLELQHDYLWRHYIRLPQKGKFGVFNRTHYENVLVTRVHPDYLLKENIPGIEKVKDIPESFWSDRFSQINAFEKLVADNKTIVLKFYLHLSKDEQKKRLLRRLDKGDRNWKFSPSDLSERKLWDDYMKCYQDAIQHTSKPHAPWYIIPADDKDIARYLVANIVWDTLRKYKDIDYPELPEEIQEQLKKYRDELLND